MQANDLEHFTKIMTILARVFNEGDIEEWQLEIYFEILKKYPIEDISGAAESLLRTYKYNNLPKPADFINFIDSEGDDALLAWLELERNNHNHSLCNDPITKQIWPRMASRYQSASISEIGYYQREFERRYKAVSQSKDRYKLLSYDKVAGLLPGLLKSI